jgi:hypothetical protein
MALYPVRSERMFYEQLDYKPVVSLVLRPRPGPRELFDHSIFLRNRARWLVHDVAHEFFTRVVAQARSLHLLSDERFTVNGTLVEAWASLKGLASSAAAVLHPASTLPLPTGLLTQTVRRKCRRSGGTALRSVAGFLCASSADAVLNRYKLNRCCKHCYH